MGLCWRGPEREGTWYRSSPGRVGSGGESGLEPLETPKKPSKVPEERPPPEEGIQKPQKHHPHKHHYPEWERQRKAHDFRLTPGHSFVASGVSLVGRQEGRRWRSRRAVLRGRSGSALGGTPRGLPQGGRGRGTFRLRRSSLRVLSFVPLVVQGSSSVSFYSGVSTSEDRETLGPVLLVVLPSDTSAVVQRSSEGPEVGVRSFGSLGCPSRSHPVSSGTGLG